MGFEFVLQAGSAWILEKCNMFGKAKSPEHNPAPAQDCDSCFSGFLVVL